VDGAGTTARSRSPQTAAATSYIGGFRVSVEAAAAALRGDGSVADCVVRSRTSEQGEEWLVAYVVSPGGFSQAQLRSRLRPLLPDYVFRHAAIVSISAVPLKASGTIDEAALERIEVIDDDLIARWEERLRAVPSIEEVVVLERESAPPLPPLHLSDVFPQLTAATQVTTEQRTAVQDAPSPVLEKVPADKRRRSSLLGTRRSARIAGFIASCRSA
jgi:hypothetical protein